MRKQGGRRGRSVIVGEQINGANVKIGKIFGGLLSLIIVLVVRNGWGFWAQITGIKRPNVKLERFCMLK